MDGINADEEDGESIFSRDPYLRPTRSSAVENL